MLYFLDTEFIEHPNTIQLISIGIVSEDGREYYAVSSEFNYDDADEWVKENVLEQIRINSVLLSKEHKKRYFYLTEILRYFRLPVIILSGLIVLFLLDYNHIYNKELSV